VNYLNAYIDRLVALCRENKVKKLHAFGSVVTGRAKPGSDIDLLVDFVSDDPLEYAENYFTFKFALQNLFDRPVDLLEERALRNQALKKSIDASKVMLYGV
jgi:predicted nucleotidyltransferase